MESPTEAELLRDSKYRAYYAQVEKALKAFESTAEWADLISALGRLNKILSSHIKYTTIPKKITIGKRLAQCLHPALPSGVHLKALETYNIIFKCIGTANLATDLFTYSAGLFPLMSYAAINVRPVVLQLYDSHFLPLQKHIKPALTGLIIALLPGLEEGSEHFEKTNLLLEDFCEAVESAYFYTCMWECLLTSVINRHAGINFILQHFNRKQSTEDQLFILGLKIDLLVEALISCVSDTSALVQRSCLDVLMLCFPIHNSQLPKSDILKLITHAILVVLRRDMSLNRRLFAWLLGTDINGLSSSFSSSSNDTDPNYPENYSSRAEGVDMTYFITYSKQMMVEAIRNLVNNFPVRVQYDESHQIETILTEDILTSKSFRVLTSILDRTEIASLILEDIFVVTLRKAFQSCYRKETEDKLSIRRNSVLPTKSTLKLTNSESLKSINLFFNFLERKFIWLFMAKLFEKCCKGQASYDSDWMNILEYCSIVEFLIDKISLDLSTETQINHFPVLIKKMALCIIENRKRLNNYELISCINLISKILQHIQPATDEFLNPNGRKNTINFDSNKLITESDEGFSVFTSEENLNIENIDSSNSSYTYSPHMLVLDKCIKACLALYEAMIEHVFAVDTPLIDFVLKLLLDKYKDASENWLIDQIGRENSLQNCDMMLRLRRIEWDKDTVDAMSAACKLLVQLSLPVISSFEHVSHKIGLIGEFPIWLKMLIICCCLVKNDGLRLEVFTCLLDLVGLTKTAIESAKDSNQRNTHVFLNPLLPASCLQIIENQTHFYRLMTSIIWNNLDSNMEDCNKFSFLLNQLHNFVSEQHLCEAVIISSLLSSDEVISLRSHEKFIKFWHFMNEKRKMMPISTSTKSFDKCLFVILDGLRSENPSRSSLIQSFVIQTIQRNDLIRLLEPLLLVLHHPNTARISIQQLRLKESNKKLNEEKQNKHEKIIKGISSIKGRVEYHINDEEIIAKLENRPPKPTYTVAVQNVTGNSWIHKADDKSMNIESDLSFDRINPNMVSVTLNPMASEAMLEDEDNQIVYASRQIKNYKRDQENVQDFKIAKRLNRDLCRKENIFFDDKEVDNDSNEEVVNYIFDILLENVEKRSFNKGTFFSNNKYIENISELVINDENLSIVSTSSEENDDCYLNNVNSEINLKDRNIASIIEKLNCHLLVYANKFDVDLILYILCNLASVLSSEPRLVICSLTTSNVGSNLIPRTNKLIDLITRHKKSILCQEFKGQIESDVSFSVKNCMFIEIIVSILLYFLRGQLFPQKSLDNIEKNGESQFQKQIKHDIAVNKELQLKSCEILNLIFSELVGIIISNGRGVANYISELLSKCKVQKTIMHCLLSSVISCDNIMNEYNNMFDNSIETIVDKKNSSVNLSNKDSNTSVEQFDFRFHNMNAHNVIASIIFFNKRNEAEENVLQSHLLKLLLSLVQLEAEIKKLKIDVKTSNSLTSMPKEIEIMKNFSILEFNLKFLPNHLIINQPMLLISIIKSLDSSKKQSIQHTYMTWLMGVVSLIPYMTICLNKFAIAILHNVCNSVNHLALLYSDEPLENEKRPNLEPDHIIGVLEGLTTITHHCILDSSPQYQQQQQINTGSISSPMTLNANNVVGLINGLASVFNFNITNKQTSLTSSKESASMAYKVTARQQAIDILPQIISAVTNLWSNLGKIEKNNQKYEQYSYLWSLGSPKMIRQSIMDLLSPLVVAIPQQVLTAIAIVWNDLNSVKCFSNAVMSQSSDRQLTLIEIVECLKLFPFDIILTNARQIIKQAFTEMAQANLATKDKVQQKKLTIEIGLLRFMQTYMSRLGSHELIDCWQLILQLLKEGSNPNLSPPALFSIIAILNDAISKISTFEDRKEQKELQDVTQKLLESCNLIASSQLEQTTFFNRVQLVKSGPQFEWVDDDSIDKSLNSSINSIIEAGQSASLYSVPALLVMSEVAAPMLDVVYLSDEKAKVAPLLVNILYKVFPYLKDHRLTNLPSYRASSKLLASMSGYQYTRKSWRKEAFDLLLDPNFFKTDIYSLNSWKTIVDNLMTHDRTTFLELLAKVGAIQGSSINLFSSRDAEMELRSQLIKRLSFTIFSSEADQYQKFMPEIQEKLSECMRVASSGLLLQTQVFFAFRVLILRVASHCLTSLWPTIITELIQVLQQIEQAFTKNENSRSFKSKGANGFSGHSSHSVGDFGTFASVTQPHLNLYLSACKLLDLMLSLPAELLPYFQLYKWAFVGDSGGSHSNILDGERRRNKDQTPNFVPHVMRIIKKIFPTINDNYETNHSEKRPYEYFPCLMMKHILSIDELIPFFLSIYKFSSTPVDPTIIAAHRSKSVPELCQISPVKMADMRDDKKKGEDVVDVMEQLVITDFIESMLT